MVRIKRIVLNDVKVRPKEHYGTLNMVMFSPEDLQLIKGEPALRRRFFDMQISQTDKAYYDLLINIIVFYSSATGFLKISVIIMPVLSFY